MSTRASEPTPRERGFLLHSQGEFDSARAHYLEALRLDAEDYEVRHALGSLCLQAGDFTAALAWLEPVAPRVQTAACYCDLGNALLGSNRPAEAIAAYQRCVAEEPEHLPANMNCAFAARQLGDLETALASYARVLAGHPDFSAAHVARAETLRDAARPDEALWDFDRALALGAEPGPLELSRAVLLAGLGRWDATARGARRAIAAGNHTAQAHLLLALALTEVGEVPAALDSYEAALALDAGCVPALVNRATLLRHAGRGAEAIESADAALDVDSGCLEALSVRAVAAFDLKRYAEALASLDRSLAIDASQAGTWCERGNACRLLNRPDDAQTSYRAAIRLNPGYADAHNGLGLLFMELERAEQAMLEFNRAIALAPASAGFHRNRARALAHLKRADAAAEAFQQTAHLAPHDAQSHADLGAALAASGRFAEAIRALTVAWQLDPANELILGELYQLKRSRCDWQDHATIESRLAASLAAGGRLQNPLTLLLLDQPALALKAARNWFDTSFPAAPAKLPAVAAPRLRIAYVSADFCEHPVSRQLIGVLEQHDRRRFEVIGISLRRSGDAFANRVRAAFDDFVDVMDASDDAIVSLLRSRNIDIAVDLMGLTLGMRPGIFAARLAPLQVNYLGFAGTLGTRHMDYIVGDATVLPAGAEQDYAEAPVRLPYCFMPMDDRRELMEPPGRVAAGLPPHGLVLCAFTQAHKIDPRMFEVWMRLLLRAPDSVLWLRTYDAYTCGNLRAAAAACGVRPERLVFAPYLVRMEEHLGRHRLADLCLDTAPLNAHSTFCDALWAGVPAITCAGGGYAARVGASSLQAAGLPDLVTHSLEEYERLAAELILQPDRLASCRRRLAEQRPVSPLFDTAGYTQSLERAYEAMQARALGGAQPAAIDIA